MERLAAKCVVSLQLMKLKQIFQIMSDIQIVTGVQAETE